VISNLTNLIFLDIISHLGTLSMDNIKQYKSWKKNMLYTSFSKLEF